MGRTFKQKYRSCWEKDQRLSLWIRSYPKNEAKAMCFYCKCELNARLADLLRHKGTQKHIEAVSPFTDKRTKQPQIAFAPTEVTPAQKAQCQLALYIAMHGSFRNADHLSNVCNNQFADSKAGAFHMHRTKCANIICNTIAPNFIKLLISDIGTAYFSLIIDESTDISVLKQLGICIRYYSKQKKEYVTTFLGLVDIASSKADGIIEGIERLTELYGLNLSKLTGVGTDNAAVMTGVNNGVHKKLKEKYNLDSLILIRCVCHSLQLAVSSAAKNTLPKNLEFLLKETHNWFAHSPGRQLTYVRIYQVINTDYSFPNKIPNISDTRWLSIEKTVKAVLKMWLELKTLFTNLPENEQCFTSELLKKMYNDDSNYLYLVFLGDVLTSVQKVNLAFEADGADHSKLFDDLLKLLKSLINRIMNIPDDFDLMQGNIDEADEELFYMGYEFEANCTKMKVSEQRKTEIKKKAFEFVKKLIEELRLKIPSNFQILSQIKLLSVENALSHLKKDIIPFVKFFNSDTEFLSDVDRAWRNIHLQVWENVQSTSKFWTEVANYEDAVKENPFQNLANFAIRIFSLPYSNAEVERIFSSMNLFKSKIRNKLNQNSVNSLLHVKYGLKRENKCCDKYEMPNEVVKLINSTAVYKKSEFELRTVIWPDTNRDDTNDGIFSIDSTFF